MSQKWMIGPPNAPGGPVGAVHRHLGPLVFPLREVGPFWVSASFGNYEAWVGTDPP